MKVMHFFKCFIGNIFNKIIDSSFILWRTDDFSNFLCNFFLDQWIRAEDVNKPRKSVGSGVFPSNHEAEDNIPQVLIGHRLRILLALNKKS